VKPASKPKFAKLAAGKTGILAYNFDAPVGNYVGGFLKTMRFACALPLTIIPVACKVTVATTCTASGGFDPNQVETTVTSYRYAGGLNATLASLTPGLPTQFSCFNNTITAKSLLGAPVDLYLDEVLHGNWVFRNI
jgi:hypothetical protein